MTTVPFWGPDFAELEQEDPEIAGILLSELERARSGLQLIASENFTSPAVLAALDRDTPSRALVTREASASPSATRR